MNKKQAVIIVTLMVLIVCAGVLATRVRSPLYVNDTDFDSDTNTNKSTVSTNDNSKKSSSTKTDVFAQGRLEREQKDQREIQTLKNIIDDKNVSNDTKSSAQQKMMTLTDEDSKCNKVETMLKSKGFKDALCSITDSKVTVTVKCDSDKLTDNQLRDIKEVVTDVTKIRNIEVLQPVH
ncbi:stage III sporulation protein AH [Clostridium acetobutylicum]|uniref:Stage III sporulation protein AH, SpoIIIAH n=1 Tax=Clostridium acetobutylicum (strain ATCC 824 / DSM 792 / JCM 1419 / IAM 19013 / LMG 5710 / NBRC 13948 / NRRL B-527 / VKM B-1787 / 2291 / W) TaxID=272562 RepID=Q97HC6_CLOAB|nr:MULTISPECIES: SpoIIIAH-like family protein [Clostridium]AAK80045.1 Stage III sporulation protein AH, SpoIIIAH [Clostridium acetobutylicum ATCC 824]ADZ21137.1 Stage III sporulation protein AH, SpoIIIAH [Clostridium acetobutylicum EA 2018]AEI32174.1 stage III sporulation protein AH, SpoIIIAH [Clostridium acetobutylicum DSM 1731]AWV79527.1 SpoIIIAH-like family protein [Clostridium acetobutylicum]KHD38234.1 stage III sporulation protein AH [Clostridium acetobutylicum]